MRFVSPEFLFALFAVAIPVIIHLFSFRRFKKIYFSNVRFLEEVKQETQSKSKLKHLLVLFSRILAITFLVFAFAQPYIPIENKKLSMGDNAVSIFVDNSFSMDAINKNGRLFDEAKKRVMEIAAVYRNTDRFQILTNDFEGKHQRFVSKEELQGLVDEIKISPATKTLKEIISRQSDLLNNSKTKNKNAYVISDFQKSVYNLGEIKNDTTINTFMIPVIAEKKNNIYIDSCWFSNPVQQVNQVQQLSVRLENKSDNAIENNPIKLFINGQPNAVASFSTEENGRAIVNLSFTLKEPGIHQAKIEISDYPITFDDQFYFSINVAKEIPILSVNSAKATNPESNGNTYLNSMYGKDSLFVFDNFSEDKLDYSSLSKYRLIVLNELKNISSGLAQELKKFMANGGSVTIFPNEDIDVNSYKSFLTSIKANYYESFDTTNAKVDRINYESELFRNVFDADERKKRISNIDLPIAQGHYKISKTTKSNEEYILKLLNGDVFLSKYTFEKGKLYLSCVPLNTNYSNFAKHALFVPAMYQMAIYSEPFQKIFYTIGEDEIIETGISSVTAENVLHIKSSSNDYDIIPECKIIDGRNTLFLHDQIQQSGNYRITDRDQLLDGLAFNYNRKESDLDCYSPDDMTKQIDSKGFLNFKMVQSGAKNLTQTLSEINEGKKLWKLCVIFALLFLGMEILLLRYWK